MIELTGIGPILRAIGLAYWLVALALLVFAFKKPATRKGKALAVATVVLLFGALPGSIVIRDALELRERRAKLAIAMARFEELCKGSGEVIYQTIEQVDGVRLLRLRPDNLNYGDQFRMDDPYGADCGGETCISGLLFDSRMLPIQGKTSFSQQTKRLYYYVDVFDPEKNEWVRYTKETASAPLSRKPVRGQLARYGIRWEDISTREDRLLWIAGGALTIVDMEAGEVVAERRGYLLDSLQGSRGAARDPWPWARTFGPTCPDRRGHNKTFITKVLNPVSEGK